MQGTSYGYCSKKAGIKNIIVPMENIGEASLVNGIKPMAEDLKSVIDFLEGNKDVNQ